MENSDFRPSQPGRRRLSHAVSHSTDQSLPSHGTEDRVFAAFNALRLAYPHIIPATVRASLARRRRLLALQGLTNPLIIASVAASATVRAKRAKGRCDSSSGSLQNKN